MPEPTPGQTAYDAYCAATGHRTYSGQATLTWNELPHAIQFAWEQSASRVRRDALHDMLLRLRELVGEQGL